MEISPLAAETAVALGFFDGIHRGHQSVLLPTAAQKDKGLTPVCLTFSQSPKSIVSGEDVPVLLSLEDKIRLLERLGIERTYFLDFKNMMHMEAQQFAEEILIGRLRAKKLFCGFNYRFGRHAQGNTDMLASICARHGVTLCVEPPASSDGSIISSTLIKRLIAGGEIERANRMLGYDFGFCGEIRHGKRLGRELGTPTLNQTAPAELIVPRFGVYASYVTLPDGKLCFGVTNVGIKPTVGGSIPLWETWMPQYTGGEIYGQQADVRLLRFIRPEYKFPGLAALRDAILRDGETALLIGEHTPLHPFIL